MAYHRDVVKPGDLRHRKYKNYEIKIFKNYEVKKMFDVLLLLVLIMAFLITVASYDSQHLKKRTYLHETYPHRAVTGRL
jgi:hypothetical protein